MLPSNIICNDLARLIIVSLWLSAFMAACAVAAHTNTDYKYYLTVGAPAGITIVTNGVEAYKNKLARQFQSTAIEKRHLIEWTLAYYADDNIVKMLIEETNRNHQRNKMDNLQVIKLANILKVLGFAGQKCDRAYEMLKAGTEEEYWRKNKKWQATDEIYSREIFTGLSIVALGISNKSEKDCYLKEIKKGSSGICGGY